MISTGDIKDKKYSILGVVGTVVNNQASAQTSSCGGSVESKVDTDTNTMYNKGADELLRLAEAKGGDAVIYASFEYRIAITGTGQFSKQVKELFCYGTAVKLAG